MEYWSFNDIETLPIKEGKILLIQTETVFTNGIMYPSTMHLIKNPKEVREIVGNNNIVSIKYIKDLR